MTKVITVDAGHGGKDPGALGGGYREKDINLSVTKKLQQELKSRGYDVFATRTTDNYLTLTARANVSNMNNSNIFISVHCNAFSDSSANGLETFHYPTSSNGKRLATAVQNAILSAGLYQTNRGVKSAKFTVLSKTKAPAILIELGFITNSKDRQILLNKQNEFAKAIADGVDSYLGNTISTPIPVPVDTTPTKITPVKLGRDNIVDVVSKTVAQMDTRILPSVTIAQAILESAWGTSDLAQNANALFGIKATKNWTGRTYRKLTWEVDKNGNKYQEFANFRAYDSLRDSIQDHDDFFVETDWRTKNYAKVVTAKDYRTQAQELKNAGYATDPQYANKLINLIEKYKLYEFDKRSYKQEVADWAADAMEWAVANGITDGNNMQDYATREEVITMIYRAFN